MNNLIIVATHKKFDVPNLDFCYKIYKNGSVFEQIDDYFSDNVGVNVSHMQPFLCELSSLYCVINNESFDTIGLCHYRRYFKYKNRIIKNDEISKLVTKYGIILPKKSKYYFYTPTSYYIKMHSNKTRELRKHYIELLSNTIDRFFPEYKEAKDIVFHKHSSHMKNMFIMKKELALNYTDFLYELLFKINNIEVLKDRALGTLGEFVMDIWLEKNKLSYKELAVFETEKKPFIIKRIWRKFICKIK